MVRDILCPGLQSVELQRRLDEDRLWHSSSLQNPPPRYDPIITPIFASMFGAGGLGFSVSTAGFLASAATAIVTTAGSILLQMALTPDPPKPEDGKVPKAQSTPYRQWVVGNGRTAGAYMLWEAKGKRLFAVQAVAGHRINAVLGYWLHDDRVELEDLDAGGRTLFDDDDRYGDNISIWHRVGLPTETAYSGIVDYLGAEGVWTNSHRGDGQASIAMVARSIGPEHQQERFPYGPPSLSVELEGALCWDFRDPAQDPDDPETWEFTKNSIIILAWHQCFNEFGHKRDYRKAILPVLDMWQEEADVCDERVPLAGGGSEARYECGGMDTTENDPKVGTNAILASCDGWLCERGDGALLVIAGKFREKYVTTLTDADLVGHRIQYDVLFEDEVNRLIPKFTYREIGYATTDTDYFEDTTAQLEAGRVLAQEGNYQWCQQWRQARRLGIRDWRRLQERVSGYFDVRLSGINSVYSRWVRMATPLSVPRLSGKLIENRRSTMALLQGGFKLEFIQHPSNIDAWNPAVDEGQQPPVPVVPNFEGIVTPVINLVQAKPRGNSVYIRVDIIDPDDRSLDPVVEYRLNDTGDGSPGAWIAKQFPNATPAGGYVRMNTDIVPLDSLLDIRVAFKSSKGTGDYSTTAHVTSTVDPIAPGTPTLTAPNSVTTVPISGKAANDNTRFLIFKRGTTAQSFAAATLIGRYSATANQTIAFDDTPGAGTWKYWCGAENGSGVPSASQAAVTTIVT